MRLKGLLQAGIIGVALLGPAFPTYAEEAGPPLLPVPPQEELASAHKLVRDAFAREYAEAEKLPAVDRGDLARILLETSRQSQDGPAAIYVLLREAIRIASEAGEPQIVTIAVVELASRFDIKLIPALRQTLDTTEKNVRTKEAKTMLAKCYVELSDRCLAVDDFNEAKEALAKARKFIQPGDDAKAIIDKQTERVKILEKAFSDLQSVRETLKKDPNNPAANLAQGKYLAYAKGNWKQGLPHLAKSDDRRVRQLALTELANPTETDTLVMLGDGWWQEAEGQSGFMRLEVQAHAADLYQRALPNTRGLVRRKIESRLQTFVESIQPPAPPTPPPSKQEKGQ